MGIYVAEWPAVCHRGAPRTMALVAKQKLREQTPATSSGVDSDKQRDSD